MQHIAHIYDPAPINQAIEEQDLTNERLAVKAGLAARTVSDVRQAKDSLRLQTLFKVTEALGFEMEIHFKKKPA
jgi:transcriptional regulator with XRE-family HTH domain